MTITIWDDHAHRFIEAESFEFTGPSAPYCLLGDRSEHQDTRYITNCDSRRHGELLTDKDFGSRPVGRADISYWRKTA